MILETWKQVRNTRKWIRKFRRHRRVLNRMYVIGGFLGTDATDPYFRKASLESLTSQIQDMRHQIRAFWKVKWENLIQFFTEDWGKWW